MLFGIECNTSERRHREATRLRVEQSFLLGCKQLNKPERFGDGLSNCGVIGVIVTGMGVGTISCERLSFRLGSVTMTCAAFLDNSARTRPCDNAFNVGYSARASVGKDIYCMNTEG